MKVLVTGMGIVSSIGNNVEECHNALQSIKHGIGPIQYLNTAHKGIVPAGEVKMSNEELGNLLLLNHKRYSRTALLGLKAAEEAFSNAGFQHSDQNSRWGLISSTSVGGIDRSEDFYQTYRIDKDNAPLSAIITHDCGDSTEHIADRLGIRDFVTTISTACSSSANAIMLGARLIRQGIIDRAVVGGTDALTKYTLNGFNALMILDSELCKPFDQDRKGLNLGEGAAYLVLESEKVVQKDNKTVLGEIYGFGNANEAFHQTASSPEGRGAFNSMSIALKSSGKNLGEIDYINAHGTATPNNDQSEGTAIKKLFGSSIPLFSSTKSYTGHTLAPAGSIEAVFSFLSINHGQVYPNLNFKTPIEELQLTPVTELLNNLSVRNIMSNSFGFGGNCSSVIYSHA